MEKLIHKKGNHYVDHIALGVSDTKEGARYVEELTGVKPFIPETQNDQWYLSAAIGLGNRSFLEIIGPNPNFKKFHPFKQLLKELKKPQLMFWYLGTDKFEACKKVISDCGYQLERYNHIVKDVRGELLDYEIAITGKGFESERPCLIRWNQSPNSRDKLESSCSLNKLELYSKDQLKLQNLLDSLGVNMKVLNGDSRMVLVIDSPKGEVKFEGGGIEFPSGFRAVFKMLKLLKNHLTMS